MTTTPDQEIADLQAFVRQQLDEQVGAVRRNRLQALALVAVQLGVLTGLAALAARGTTDPALQWLAFAGVALAAGITSFLAAGSRRTFDRRLLAYRELNETLRLLDRLAVADPSLAGLTPEVVTDRVRRGLERAIGLPRGLSVQVPELRLPDRPLVRA